MNITGVTGRGEHYPDVNPALAIAVFKQRRHAHPLKLAEQLQCCPPARRRNRLWIGGVVLVPISSRKPACVV